MDGHADDHALDARVATLADVHALVTLINRAYEVEHFFVTGSRIDADQVRERILAPLSRFLVLDAESRDGVPQLAGSVYAVVSERGGYFGLLAVDPAHQRRGLGKRLVNVVERFLESQGCETIDIEVVDLRTEMFPFYDRLGYAQYTTSPFPVPEKLLRPAHMILMRKSLR